MRLGDRAGERALDRQDADVDRAVRRRLRDRGEAREGDELRGVAEQTVAGGRAVGAVPSRVADDRVVVMRVVHLSVQMSSKGPPRFDS